MAEDYVTVEGERSKYFGPDGTYYQGGNGVTVNNLDSDFFFQQIKDSGIIDRLLALAPPRGPKPEVKQSVRGLRGRLQPLPVRRGAAGTGSRPQPCTGKRVGAADHREGRLPPLLPTGRAGERRRRDPRHCASATAHAVAAARLYRPRVVDAQFLAQLGGDWRN